MIPMALKQMFDFVCDQSVLLRHFVLLCKGILLEIVSGTGDFSPSSL